MDPIILQHLTPLHQRRLTEAIADAYRRGDDVEVDALLTAKTVLIRRERGVGVDQDGDAEVAEVAFLKFNPEASRRLHQIAASERN